MNYAHQKDLVTLMIMVKDYLSKYWSNDGKQVQLNFYKLSPILIMSWDGQILGAESLKKLIHELK